MNSFAENAFSRVFSITDTLEWDALALEVFRFQAAHCRVYREYLHQLNYNVRTVKKMEHIPFLPIEFFKTHDVICDGYQPELLFESSGTTGEKRSKHLVAQKRWYDKSLLGGFTHFFGPPESLCILALLPSYEENKNSSLIYMMNELIGKSKCEESGFYSLEGERLKDALQMLNQRGKQTLLIGVTYALLEFAEKNSLQLNQTIILETGGMKGRREELVREEVHRILCKGFGVDAIGSEYGMTELLSQAYSKGKGIFQTPPWMKIQIRDINDPFSNAETGATGGIGIIDLANIFSCSFIATADLGRKISNSDFEVLGRFDFSELRGCNLLSF